MLQVIRKMLIDLSKELDSEDSTLEEKDIVEILKNIKDLMEREEELHRH